MSVAVVEPGTLPNTPPTRRQAARTRFPPRLPMADWPATRQSREEILRQLTSAPFVLEKANSQQIRRNGVSLLLDWLVDQPGETWQERWHVVAGPARPVALEPVERLQDLRVMAEADNHELPHHPVLRTPGDDVGQPGIVERMAREDRRVLGRRPAPEQPARNEFSRDRLR